MSEQPTIDEMTHEELIEQIVMLRELLALRTIEVDKAQKQSMRHQAEYEGMKKRSCERMYSMQRLLVLLIEHHTTHGARKGQLEMLMWIAGRWAAADSADFLPDIDAHDIPF